MLRMVELKNGETYSGVLASCDGFMNLPLAPINGSVIGKGRGACREAKA